MNDELMASLLEFKDKNKASQKKRNAFETEWLSYVEENGMNDTAITYLYKGFAYKNMSPYVSWVKRQEDKLSAINLFLSNKEYYDDRPKSFKMTLNLFAMVLNEIPSDTESIALIIKHLPGISYNKDKKRNPEIGKSFSRYLISELKNDVAYPIFAELLLRPAMINDFLLFMNEGLDAASNDGEKKPDDIQKVEKLKAWLFTASDLQKTEEQPVHPENSEKRDYKNAENNIPAQNEKKEAESMPVWRSHLKAVVTYVEGLESAYKQVKTRNDLLSETKEQQQKNIEQLKTIVSSKDAEIAALTDKCREQEYQIQKRDIEIAALKESIAAKEAEIADRIKYTDIISKDRAKQSDAVLQRLSSELSSYYNDFKSAENDEISAEIGEVLRDQLADVYKILSKNGVAL